MAEKQSNTVETNCGNIMMNRSAERQVLYTVHSKDLEITRWQAEMY